MTSARSIMKQIVVGLAVAWSLFCLGILGLELCARFLDLPQNPRMYIEHPLYGTIRPPNLRVPSTWGDQKYAFQTNSLGFRGSEMGVAKPPGTFRIVFVGSSVVEGYGFPFERTFPGLVEQLLNEKLGSGLRVEVGAVSYPGNGSVHSLAMIANRILPLEPDLVLELDAAEFFWGLQRNYEPTMLFLAKPDDEKLGHALMRSSRFMEWASALGTTGNGKDLLESSQAHRDLPTYDDLPESLLSRGLDRWMLNLHRSALLCRDAGVQFGVLTQNWIYKEHMSAPELDSIWLLYKLRNLVRWNLTPSVARRMVDAYNEGIRRVAENDRLILIDLDRLIPKDLVHLADDVHPTKEGHAAIAAAVVSTLLEQKVFAAQPIVSTRNSSAAHRP
ncbi:MAG: SGNH/GDSL hydrolase family protein [Deltaproteobacteria bacterium]|nr:SGNH/GDSL hydrolase family protein [Deltaproteobacteria bacterium]